MEKSSRITMTKEDLNLYQMGIVSERLAQLYSISHIIDLALIVDQGMYETVSENTEIKKM